MQSETSLEMKRFTFFITIFYIIFELCCEVTTIETDWLNNLIKEIQINNREHQVLFLVNDLNESSLTENIIHKISKKVPVSKICFEEILANYKTTPIANIQTSLAIIIHFSDDINQLEHIFEILTEFLGSKTRPRCLICLSKEHASNFYNNFLIKMWNKRFLDTTILEFLDIEVNNLGLNTNKKIPFLHHYNPYQENFSKYYRIKYYESVSLFPQKTRNLHGHQLKVGLVNVPPFVNLIHDNNSKLITSRGTDVSLTEELAKVMNFNILWDAPIDESEWGSSLNCTKENSTGLLYKLMHNELDFMGFENGRYGACYEDFYEHSKSTKFAKISIVVPILRTQANATLNTDNICYIILFIVLFLITWAISYFILYKPPSLNILQVGRILLGTTAPNEPNKSAERFVFAAILISCMLQASFIYTLIAENNLNLDFKAEPKTIDDVIKFNLLPVIGIDYYRAFKRNINDTDIHNLLEMADTKIKTNTCFDRMENEKNVACITRSEVAHSKIKIKKDVCGRPIMKVLNHFLRFTTSGMNMESGSPLVRQFDKIIQRFIESGLVKKWQQENFDGSSIVVESGDCSLSFLSEKKNIKSQILYIFTVGYMCATITFMMELLYVKYLKRVI